MDYLNLTDREIMADPHWLQRMHQAAEKAYQRIGSTHQIFRDNYFRLMQLVPTGKGPETIAALNRVIATMRAFQRLTPKQRGTLEGKIYELDVRYMQALRSCEPDALVKVRLEYIDEVWASDPYLASLREMMEADHARVARLQEEEREKHIAAIQARDKAKADAPGYVLQLHQRGIRLNLTADGKLALFPASLLTQEDLAFARDYGSFLADAMQAETLTHTVVSQVR